MTDQTPSRRWPNLFIVGPHKTGTTTWYDLLDDHPEVHMSPVKEPEFLNTDHDYTHRPTKSEGAYLDLWSNAQGETYLGEATPWYFYSQAAAEAIREQSPDPRVLITLRDPVERIYSLHSQRLHAGTETIESFEEALAAEPDRKQGKRLPERRNPVLGCFYREIAAYTPHVQRYMDLFDDHELMILRFEDVISDQEATFRELCGWLGIDPDVGFQETKSNPNSAVRSPWFRRIVREPPAPVLKVTQLFPEGWRRRLRQGLHSLNAREVERPPMDPELRAQVVEELLPDIQALEELLGWDLSDWKSREVPAR